MKTFLLGVSMFRYSKGFGIAKYLLGEESPLNLPNCVIGIGFYTLQFILGTVTNAAL